MNKEKRCSEGQADPELLSVQGSDSGVVTMSWTCPLEGDLGIFTAVSRE